MNNYESFDTINEFNEVITEWESALDSYTLTQLNYKPSEIEWSIGQVYSHILDAGLLYMLGKADRCLNENENLDGKLSERGEQLFKNNSFPEIEIKIPAHERNQPSIPESKEEIYSKIEELKKAMDSMDKKLVENPPTGKSPHRFIDYLDAFEWFQIIPIHMRHHLRQKSKLEKLQGIGN